MKQPLRLRYYWAIGRFTSKNAATGKTVILYCYKQHFFMTLAEY